MKSTNTASVRWGLPIFATLTIAAAQFSSAAFVNVSFEHSTEPSPPASSLVGPAGGLGETWNQTSAPSGSSLLDSSGVPTTVGYSSSNLGGPDQWADPNLKVLLAGLRNFDTSPGNSQTFRITGLNTGDLYDVWIASANSLDFARSGGEWTTTNNTTSPSTQVVSNVFSGVNGDTWVAGNNYVLYEDVEVNGAGELVFNGFSYHKDSVEGGGDGTAGSSTHDPRLPVNGFQLEQVPEPSSLALLGLGGLLILRRRR